MCLNTGTPKIINFPFETNGKLMILCISIFKRIRVYFLIYSILSHNGAPQMRSGKRIGQAYASARR